MLLLFLLHPMLNSQLFLLQFKKLALKFTLFLNSHLASGHLNLLFLLQSKLKKVLLFNLLFEKWLFMALFLISDDSSLEFVFADILLFSLSDYRLVLTRYLFDLSHYTLFYLLIFFFCILKLADLFLSDLFYFVFLELKYFPLFVLLLFELKYLEWVLSCNFRLNWLYFWSWLKLYEDLIDFVYHKIFILYWGN